MRMSVRMIDGASGLMCGVAYHLMCGVAYHLMCGGVTTRCAAWRTRRGERPDEGRDRDPRGGPNPCARYGANYTLQDGECRPYVRR